MIKDRITKRSCILLTAILLALIVAAIYLLIPHGKPVTIRTANDLARAHIGVQLGTTSDLKVSPLERRHATIERFTKTADAIQALEQGKINCVVEDELPARAFQQRNGNLHILPQAFSSDDYAFCVARQRKDLCEDINKALRQLLNSGILDSIADRQTRQHIAVAYEPRQTAHPNGTLIVATNATFPPYEYYENGRVCGIDIDIMQAVCDVLGMTMQVEDMNFDAVITSVQTGKADVGAAALTVSPDRSKNVLFTAPYSRCRQVIIVKDAEKTTRSLSFTEKFRQDFLVEGRYLYLFQGLGNTLVITLFAILISLCFGSLIAIIRTTHERTGRMKFLNSLCQLYLVIIRGTPTMVQLLIIYYVVFASVDVSKVLVAIVAFGINSSAYLAEVVRSGIMSIDRGQTEAGRSLGLSYGQTLRLIILPQAYKNVLPAIGNELITLLKETSIAGYIGLVDLTKGSDIIRSITYDAMLPLTVVALIYLVLVLSLSAGVNHLEKNLRKNERK
ncbi:MAG: ABC transporter substrate-binding protein/permease [Prevotellaceae bacterium]|nr:ABC transporter substrate-binding protein/permease [Prevotellaceae bacterium]